MPSPPSSQSLPFFFFKLAAAAVAGGAALLSFLRLRRRFLLSSLRLDLLNSLLLLLLRNGHSNSAVRPPSILVTGFRSHGKSALVNTICRVLAAERGPLVMRSETAPPGPTPATLARRVIRADVAGLEEAEEKAGEEERAEVGFVDGVGFPAAEEAGATKADVEAEVAGPSGGGDDVEVDCVMVVVRCGAPAKERRMAVRRLADVASAVRGRGLHLVVVLTQKKALKSAKQAEELRREVAYRARTDCVYFIENYTAGASLNIHHPNAIKNAFDTQLTVLTIVRQCVEFARLYRSHSSRKANSMRPPTINLSSVMEQ